MSCACPGGQADIGVVMGCKLLGEFVLGGLLRAYVRVRLGVGLVLMFCSGCVFDERVLLYKWVVGCVFAHGGGVSHQGTKRTKLEVVVWEGVV